MKNTLAQLNELNRRWTALRKQRPTEDSFAQWGYPDITIEDIDEALESLLESVEIASKKTKAANESTEKLLDSSYSKLVAALLPQLDAANSNGMQWLVTNTQFLVNLASVISQLIPVLNSRVDVRKALLKIASSTVNENLLTVEKVAPIANEVVAYHDKISGEKDAIESALSISETAKDQCENIEGKATENLKNIEQLLAEAQKDSESINEQKISLNSAIESAQKILSELEELKLLSDQEIGLKTENLKAANESIAKALQDVNRQGLAGAFRNRTLMLNIEKFVWVFFFALSLGWLIFVASGTVSVDAQGNVVPFDPMNLLKAIPFAAPGIWLGWFSAKQISMLGRIHQDYAFKASTAVAFEGYKKEVVSIGDDQLVAKLLETAIQNFGDNPVRLYPNSDEHGHPLESVLEKVKDKDTREFLVQMIKAITPGKSA